MPRTRRSSGLLALITFGAAAVYAQGALGLKAGLWEVRLTKQVVDGKDNSAQVAAAMAKAQQALASLPPAQREQIEAMMAKSGVNQGANGNFRLCISPEMAKRNTFVLDKDNRCHPAEVSRSPGHATFHFDCTANGVQTTGTGEATLSDNLIAVHTDVTTHATDGSTHTMQNETQMQYVGSDCGTLKPVN